VEEEDPEEDHDATGSDDEYEAPRTRRTQRKTRHTTRRSASSAPTGATAAFAAAAAAAIRPTFTTHTPTFYYDNNPFLVYVKKHRPALLQQGLRSNEVVERLSRRWSMMNDKERASYRHVAMTTAQLTSSRVTETVSLVSEEEEAGSEEEEEEDVHAEEEEAEEASSTPDDVYKELVPSTPMNGAASANRQLAAKGRAAAKRLAATDHDGLIYRPDIVVANALLIHAYRNLTHAHAPFMMQTAIEAMNRAALSLGFEPIHTRQGEFAGKTPCDIMCHLKHANGASRPFVSVHPRRHSPLILHWPLTDQERQNFDANHDPLGGFSTLSLPSSAPSPSSTN